MKKFATITVEVPENVDAVKYLSVMSSEISKAAPPGMRVAHVEISVVHPIRKIINSYIWRFKWRRNRRR